MYDPTMLQLRPVQEVQMSADIVDKIMTYEQGDMDEQETVKFFEELINTGLASRLQGHYGRTAARLIEAGLVQPRKATK